MKRFVQAVCLAAALVAAAPANAAMRILATTADWGSLAKELGGDKVDVYTATSALQDVHYIDARPSLVARARTARLVVATGADLEIGWLPVLLRESGNPSIQPGQPGYFEAANYVHLRDVPAGVDRAMGDIHPLGNPHLHLDPHNVAAVATALTARLKVLDPGNAAYYDARSADFHRRWATAMVRWEAEAAPLRGLPVVIVHSDETYLCHWLGMKQVASIEPKPGVPPSAGYLAQLVTQLSATPARLILRNAYNDPRAAEWLSARTGIPVVTMPFSVGGSDAARDLFGLFDDTIHKLLEAAK